MKKQTTLFKSLSLRAQLTSVIFAVSFFLTPSLFAVDILLGQYEFTTGTDQTKPTSVSSGITFSEIIIGVGNIPSNAISASYSGDALLTSNWSTSANTGAAKKAVQFSITKDAATSGFKVNRVDVTFKRSVATTTTSGKIQLNYGASYPTNMYTGYVSTGNIGTTTFNTYQMPTPSIPAVINTTPQYLAFGPSTATTADIITIDKIEVYGTVSFSPAFGTDKTSLTIKTSKGHSASTSFVVTGASMTDATNFSFVGGNASDFSVDKASIDAATLNGGSQTVLVSANATASLSARTTTLHIESVNATSVDIPLTATCDLFHEDFSNYDAASSNTTLAGLVALNPEDAAFSQVLGWTGNKIYSFKASSPNLGTVCIGNTSSDSAFLTTPPIDLSQPFKFSFKTRNLAGNTDGRYKVYLDGTELICEGQQATTALVKITSPTFKGTANSKLTFTGLKVSLNNILIDSIVVNNSLTPDLLNVPSSKTINFGSVVQGSELTINTPIQACNLAGDLSVSLKNGVNFSLVSNAAVSLVDATAGTSISVKFTAPFTTTEIIDTLIISSTSMTRKIPVKATPTITTSIISSNNQLNEPVISFANKIVKLNNLSVQSLVRVYNSLGRLVANKVAQNSSMEIPLLIDGLYIIQIEAGSKNWTKKVVNQN
jgi:hypothetical protein